jgi:hypothetical protein
MLGTVTERERQKCYALRTFCSLLSSVLVMVNQGVAFLDTLYRHRVCAHVSKVGCTCRISRHAYVH